MLPRRTHCIKVINILQLSFFVGIRVTRCVLNLLFQSRVFTGVGNLRGATSKFGIWLRSWWGRGALESMLGGNMLDSQEGASYKAPHDLQVEN